MRELLVAVQAVAGHATTEVWAATEWLKFKAMVRELPEVSGLIPAGV